MNNKMYLFEKLLCILSLGLVIKLHFMMTMKYEENTNISYFILKELTDNHSKSPFFVSFSHKIS